MILDGYNRRAILPNGLRVLYRPLSSAYSGQRKLWRYELRFLGDAALRRATDEWVLSRVVAWDWEHSIDSIRRLRFQEDSYSQFLRLLHGVEPDASGERWRDVESDYAENLREGVILELTDPKLARRSCEDCQRYWYLTDGTVLTQTSTGERQLRPTFAFVSCETEFGCPKGTPENQKSLNRVNKYAYLHFRKCESVGQFPDDEIVQRNAEIIRKAIREVERRNKVK